MTGTLSGVRVIDMTTVYSGPIAASILGDQGADVVKVEKPGGDMQRGMFRVARNGLDGQFAMNNRNKRSIVIDLSNDQGKSVLRRFIASADVPTCRCLVSHQNLTETVAECSHQEDLDGDDMTG